MIVKRTLPGGRPVRKRSIIAWSALHRGGAALVAGAEQHRAAVGEREERRDRRRESSSGGASRGSVGMPSGNGRQIDLELAAAHAGRHAIGERAVGFAPRSHGGKRSVALGSECGERVARLRRSPPSTRRPSSPRPRRGPRSRRPSSRSTSPPRPSARRRAGARSSPRTDCVRLLLGCRLGGPLAADLGRSARRIPSRSAPSRRRTACCWASKSGR